MFSISFGSSRLRIYQNLQLISKYRFIRVLKDSAAIWILKPYKIYGQNTSEPPPSHLHPYPLSHNFLLSMVLPYGLVFAYVSYFMLYVEGNTLCCYKNNSDKWTVATSMEKYDPTFYIDLKKNTKKSVEMNFSIGDVIDEDGMILDELVLKKVQGMIKEAGKGEKVEGKKDQ